jgi:rieske iron-sulfur protein
MSHDDSELTRRAFARRSVLRAGCAMALAGTCRARADETDERSQPPRENDVLVFAFGATARSVIMPADLAVGAKQTLAYPMNPATGTVRDGTRLNQLIVVRVDPLTLSDATKVRAADGVVAYSGVCTHTGCDVTDWIAAAQRFKCPCHESEFDPADAARVVSGPAPWQLAALPLKMVDGMLAIAGPFEGNVGFAQPGLDPFGAAPSP